MIIEFMDDDRGYIAWLADHPDPIFGGFRTESPVHEVAVKWFFALQTVIGSAQVTQRAPGGGVDAEGGEDLGLERTWAACDDLSVGAVPVDKADHADALELTKGPTGAERLTVQVRIADPLPRARSSAMTASITAASTQMASVTADGLFGVVKDRSAALKKSFSTRRRQFD